MKSIFLASLILPACLLFSGIAHAQQPDATLAIHRKKIDSLDQQLIAILGERERVVKEVGIYKAENHIPALQKARFREILEKNIKMGAKEGLSERLISKVMNAIHEESLSIERALKKEATQ